MKNKFIILFCFCLGLSQAQIGAGLHSEDLIDFLQQNYTTNNVLSYNSARDIMYGEIYNNNGQVSGIYTDFTINNVPTNDPRPIVTAGGIDCEHIWPQSMYDGSSPMKSDMHHLRPCKSNVKAMLMAVEGINPLTILMIIILIHGFGLLIKQIIFHQVILMNIQKVKHYILSQERM